MFWKIVLLFLFLINIQLYSRSGFGNLYDPGRRLFNISTKYFDIIYSLESKDSAFYLSTFADSTFERLNSFLKSKHKERITVIITPDAELENGMTSIAPFTHIILLDYHINTSWFNEKEYFKDLFTHELTHAISLNIKSSLFEVLSTIFGNYMTPNITMPEFMIEGVAVSFESLEGNGRVFDPAVREELKQDILENCFKDPAQASGAYDLYPRGNVYYYYGGLFNHYIQEKYGMDKYALLWLRNGGNFPYTLPLVFKDVYGISILKEWNNFKDSLKVNGPIDTNTNIIFPFNVKKKTIISSPVLSSGKIFYDDGFEDAIMVYDIKERKVAKLLDMDGDIAVSGDGSRLLIKGSTMVNGVYKTVTRVYDIKNKKYLSKKIETIGEANFFNNDIVAVKSRTHKTDLVLIKENGDMKTLFSGSEDISLRNPVQYSDNEIVFLLIDKGIRKISKYNIDTGEVSVFDIPADYIGRIGVYDGKIIFSYNNDYTFYKLGIIDKDRVFLQTNNISGGVFDPMIDGDSIYYTGSFSEGNSILKYPENLDHLDGIITNYRLDKYETKYSENEENKIVNNSTNLKIRDYNPLLYFLPHLWVPYFTLGKNNIPDSAGIFTYMQDPVYQNSIMLYTTYNYIKEFQNVNVNWNNTSYPINFTAAFSDFLPYYNSINSYIRQTAFSLNLNYVLYFIPINYYFTLGGTASYNLWTFDTSQSSAYYWNNSFNTTVATAYATYSTSLQKYNFYDYKGFDITAFFDQIVGEEYYKTETSINVYPSILPVIININVAYSPWKFFNLASESLYFGNDHYPAYNEYRNIDLNSSYFLSGGINALLFNFEIQKGFWLLPYYINRLYLTGGYRNAYIEDQYFYSVYTRLNLGSSVLYGVLPFNIYLEGNYAFNTKSWGFYFNMDLPI